MTPVTDRKDLEFMLLLASFCALLLIMTRAAIGERAEISLRSVDAILQIAGEETLPIEEQLLDRFNQLFSRRAGGRIKFWQGCRRPELWACEATGNGMWAEITLAFIIDTATGRLLGLRVVEQNETAGLGSLITDENFSEKFAGLHAAAGVALAPFKALDNQFDAVTGATTSSKAVEKILNRALTELKKLRGAA